MYRFDFPLPGHPDPMAPEVLRTTARMKRRFTIERSAKDDPQRVEFLEELAQRRRADVRQ